MSDYLLHIAIGPVQDFIAAARRTRDLWSGSFILSEIGKAVALSLQKQSCILIFPAPLQPGDLEPDTDFNVANKILAQVPAAIVIQDLVSKAQEAAKRRWLEFGEETWKDAQDAVGSRADMWKKQRADVIEFYAAWVPLNGDYPKTRRRAEQLLAGNKALRAFEPAAGRELIPKSSLDGARESVLEDPKKLPAQARARANLKNNEQLDAVGLIKRLTDEQKHGREDRFVSVSRIAVDPWVRGVWNNPKAKAKLEQIKQLCDGEFVSRVRGEVFRIFPWDGEILLPARLREMIGAESGEYLSNLEEIQKILESMVQRKDSGLGLGEPYPYLAMLLADGDRMGETLSAMKTAQENQNFSQQLSKFAQEAGRIIKEHRGCLVYSGGDDIMALLSMDQCLTAARELHEKFREIIAQVVQVETPTLSVGIAIVHCLEPLEDIRQLAREAEEIAKSGVGAKSRNGLAVCLQKRGGGKMSIRDQWTDDEHSIDKRLGKWILWLMEERLPDGFAYDLYRLAQHYGEWPKDKLTPELINAEVKRVLGKKRSRGHKLDEKTIAEICLYTDNVENLHRTAHELIIARELAKATGQAKKGENL